jgi:cytoskeletal protein CcmA (bactofilin family)
LDRLHWLLDGKPTPSEFEDLGELFNPQFRFLALLPSPAMPASEASRAERYFDAMFETLAAVRDLIAAYSLRGVMSRSPISDFSLEVQFSDPDVVDTVRRSLPRELSGCAVTHQRRYENPPATSAEVSMFFRDKGRQENPGQKSSEQSPAQGAARTPESSTQESTPPVTIAMPAPALILAQPAQTTPTPAPTPSRESGRKKMLVPDGVTLRGGDILGCAHMAIEGEAYLTIDRCENLEVSENGIFHGSASVDEAEISGYCKGTLVVKGTLRITGTGHVVGSIQYGRLQVENGGRIEGEMKMPTSTSETEPEPQSDNPRWADLSAKLSA